eukprot:2802075-Amphidinium_carterae.1
MASGLERLHAYHWSSGATKIGGCPLSSFAAYSGVCLCCSLDEPRKQRCTTAIHGKTHVETFQKISEHVSWNRTNKM